MPNSNIEQYIEDIMYHLEIYKPERLSIEMIANQMNIEIHFKTTHSRMLLVQGQYHIILNKNASQAKQWEDFGHELGHVLRHVGNQHFLSAGFRGYQESQADNFMYHFCAPTFMIERMDFESTEQETILKIAETFNVTISFAKKRFEMYKRKLLEEEISQWLSESYEQEKLQDYETCQQQTSPDIHPIGLNQVMAAPGQYQLINAYDKEFFITREEYEVYKYILYHEIDVFYQVHPNNVEMGFRTFLNEFNIESYQKPKVESSFQYGNLF